MRIPTARLGDARIPRTIVGCWQLSEDHRSGRPDERARFLPALAREGLTTFDCADIYPGVEERLGRFRREWIDAGEDPDRLRFHTKLVPDRSTLDRVDRPVVEAIVDRSRRRLGVEVLDLVQFHWWDFGVPGWIEAAEHLAELREAGRIRQIGVTNFDAEHLEALLDAGVPVVSNQVQVSLLDRRAGELEALCRDHGIALLAYGTLAGGFLSEAWLGREDPGPDPGNRSLVKYRLIVEENGGWDALQALLRILRDVAEQRATRIADVALRWALDRPAVAAAIVGLSDPERSPASLAAHDPGLGLRDHRLLDGWLSEHAGPRGPVYGLERIPGGRHAVVMKTELNRAG